MQKTTITCPSIGTEAYFTFKEPAVRSLQNRLGTSASQIQLKVSAINEIRELLQSELRDPFLEAYAPLGLDQAQYNRDLQDNVVIITFKFTDISSAVKYVRVPITYVAGYDSVVDIQYFGKTIVLDLGAQHQDLDLSAIHSDLADFVRTRTGITPNIKEVTIGDPIKITAEEHANREAIRTNEISVFKTTSATLEEMNVRYQNLVNRVRDLGIVLGGS